MAWYIPYIEGITLGAILATLVKITWSASKLSADVKEIKDNHLPHLYTEIRNLRDAFTRHVDKGGH